MSNVDVIPTRIYMYILITEKINEKKKYKSINRNILEHVMCFYESEGTFFHLYRSVCSRASDSFSSSSHTIFTIRFTQVITTIKMHDFFSRV